jgi:hypothetical protein
VAELEARRLLYILGVRERSDKLVREPVQRIAVPPPAWLCEHPASRCRQPSANAAAS